MVTHPTALGNTEIEKHINTEIQKHRNTEIHEYRYTEIQKHRNTKTQKHRKVSVKEEIADFKWSHCTGLTQLNDKVYL